MLNPDRCENAKELYWGEGRRPAAHDRLALDAVVALSREADVFLDIGSYTGLFTLAVAAADPTVTTHAFEIVPAVVKALQANIRRNGVDDRVRVHAEGIGKGGETVTMPTGEGGSALPSFYSTRMHFDHGEAIPMRSLDSIAELVPEGSSVVMKIDVEGTEDVVFKSGQQFLSSLRPHILCEVLANRADGRILDDLLRPAALHRYLVTDSALLEMESITPDARYRDWLFTRHPAELLRDLGLPVGD